MISSAPGRVIMIDSFEILGRIKGVSNGAYKQAISQWGWVGDNPGRVLMIENFEIPKKSKGI